MLGITALYCYLPASQTYPPKLALVRQIWVEAGFCVHCLTDTSSVWQIHSSFLLWGFSTFCSRRGLGREISPQNCGRLSLRCPTLQKRLLHLRLSIVRIAGLSWVSLRCIFGTNQHQTPPICTYSGCPTSD